jgi:hypothetical protein
METSGQLHELAALHQMKEPKYKLDRSSINPKASLAESLTNAGNSIQIPGHPYHSSVTIPNELSLL